MSPLYLHNFEMIAEDKKSLTSSDHNFHELLLEVTSFTRKDNEPKMVVSIRAI